jgi:hypothetical protein
LWEAVADRAGDDDVFGVVERGRDESDRSHTLKRQQRAQGTGNCGRGLRKNVGDLQRNSVSGELYSKGESYGHGRRRFEVGNNHPVPCLPYLRACGLTKQGLVRGADVDWPDN